jgi:hypothetical protein
MHFTQVTTMDCGRGCLSPALERERGPPALPITLLRAVCARKTAAAGVNTWFDASGLDGRRDPRTRCATPATSNHKILGLPE